VLAPALSATLASLHRPRFVPLASEHDRLAWDCLLNRLRTARAGSTGGADGLHGALNLADLQHLRFDLFGKTAYTLFADRAFFSCSLSLRASSFPFGPLASLHREIRCACQRSAPPTGRYPQGLHDRCPSIAARGACSHRHRNRFRSNLSAPAARRILLFDPLILAATRPLLYCGLGRRDHLHGGARPVLATRAFLVTSGSARMLIARRDVPAERPPSSAARNLTDRLRSLA